MCPIPDSLVLAGLGVQWAWPDFCHGFQAQAEPVMKFSGEGFQSGHGIRWCNAGQRFLAKGMGGTLAASADWACVQGYSGPDPESALALAAICSRFSYFDTVLVHSAVVDYQGQGVLFVGPSGIGKTTQAELWARHMGAQIINGDKGLLRRFPEGEIVACGLPWKGSSPYCLNRNVPVKAVVALRQSRENRIRRLRPLECMEFFLPHIFLPHWDEECMNRALDTASDFIEQLPIYLLECRPDQEAVGLTAQTIL